MANVNNPNDALRTPNVYSGITSEQGFAAGIANGFSDGIISGFEVKANSPAGMSVLVGGDSGVKDTLYVKSSTGDMYTIFNGSNSPIEVTIPEAPTANSRIDSIVVYRDVAASGDGSITDNPNCVGIMVVSGTSASNPVAPNDATIRKALPNGSTALYKVIRTVNVASGVKAITDSNINNDRPHAFLNNDVVQHGPAHLAHWVNNNFNGTYIINIPQNKKYKRVEIMANGELTASSSGTTGLGIQVWNGNDTDGQKSAYFSYGANGVNRGKDESRLISIGDPLVGGYMDAHSGWIMHVEYFNRAPNWNTYMGHSSITGSGADSSYGLLYTGRQNTGNYPTGFRMVARAATSVEATIIGYDY